MTFETGHMTLNIFLQRTVESVGQRMTIVLIEQPRLQHVCYIKNLLFANITVGPWTFIQAEKHARAIGETEMRVWWSWTLNHMAEQTL